MTRPLTDRHHDALARLVQTLDPDGTATIADLDAVLAEAASLDPHDLDRITITPTPTPDGPPHPALPFALMIDAPERELAWFRQARLGDLGPTWDHATGVAYHPTGGRWPEWDSDPVTGNLLPQPSRTPPAGRDASAGSDYPTDPSRPATTILDALPTDPPPIRRRRLVPEEFP